VEVIGMGFKSLNIVCFKASFEGSQAIGWNGKPYQFSGLVAMA
jgi:hypothetical protein